MASSQRRCVFVGNIPYDATEEQLIEICQEVGPVVSFRLVIDRETGKPKGYGFCEYKDEETALSARRNLQGYEINGRQLRVDFAENDKSADRNREQGRGGPGLAANVDPQRQLGTPMNQGNFINHQPIGVHVAITASMVMAGALGGPQGGVYPNQSDLQNQSTVAHDPLTFHLAKMTRTQLTEVMSELKMMATKDKELAHRLLLSRPQLSKALFQAQIMLNMVTPQVLQMPNLQQPPGQFSQGQPSQQAAFQATMGLPPSATTKLPSGMEPKLREGQGFNVAQNPLVHNQFAAPVKPPIQTSVPLQFSDNRVLPQDTPMGQSSSTLPSIQSQSLSSIPNKAPIQSNSLPLKQQNHPLQHQQRGQAEASSSQTIRANTFKHSSVLPHLPLSDASIQAGPSTSSGLPHISNKEVDRPPEVLQNPNWIQRSSISSKMPFGSTNKGKDLLTDSSDPNNRSSKLLKLHDGGIASYSRELPRAVVNNGSSQVFRSGALPVNIAPGAEMQLQQKRSQVLTQTPIPPEVESALLQQVLNLTPEQLRSLPPEQQQQVIQLQEAIRRDKSNSS